MEDEVTSYSAGAIMDYIPDILQRHALTDIVVHPGPNKENERGGVSFTVTVNDIGLRWKVIHNWGDLFTVLYTSPNDEYHEDLPFTEEMDASSFVATMNQLTDYMLDTELDKDYQAVMEEE